MVLDRFKKWKNGNCHDKLTKYKPFPFVVANHAPAGTTLKL